MTFVPKFPNTRRIVFVAYVDVTQGNLNGDPSAGNAPRMDEITGYGEVSDVSIKRHIRDGWSRDGLELFIDRFVPLASKKMEVLREIAPDADLSSLGDDHEVVDEAADADTEGKAKGRAKKATKKMAMLTPDQISMARDAACRKFIDIRAFGAVMQANQKIILPNVRGCVVVNFATSIDPIQVREHQIARTTTENDEVARGNASKNQTFGTKPITPYALYQVVFTLDVATAHANFFTNEDYDRLIEQVLALYQYDASASRGSYAGLQALYAVHCTARGVATYSTSQIMTHFRAQRRPEVDLGRRFSDYEIGVARDNLPKDTHLEVLRAPVYAQDLDFQTAA